MRKRRLTEEQLGQDPARSVAQQRGRGCHEARSQRAPTIYAWRKHFDTIEATDVKRLKGLELESSRLRKLLAESALDIEVLNEINAQSGAPVGAVRAARAGLSPGPVVASCLRAAQHLPLVVELRVAHAGQRRAHHPGHAGSLHTAPTLRPPAGPRHMPVKANWSGSTTTSCSTPPRRGSRSNARSSSPSTPASA